MDFSEKIIKMLGMHSILDNGQKFLSPTLVGPMGAEISARQNFFEVIFCSKLAKNRYNFKNMGDRGGVSGLNKLLRPHTLLLKNIFVMQKFLHRFLKIFICGIFFKKFDFTPNFKLA